MVRKYFPRSYRRGDLDIIRYFLELSGNERMDLLDNFCVSDHDDELHIRAYISINPWTTSTKRML